MAKAAKTVTVRKEKADGKSVKSPAVKKSKEIAAVAPADDPFGAVYGEVFDEVEKSYNLGSTELSLPNKLSTDFLVLDTLTGGGIAAGTMQILSGEEHSGKSTSFLEILGRGLDRHIGFSMFNDIEGALVDEIYAARLIGKHAEAFLKGELKSHRIIRKRIIEDYFNACQAVLVRLPDKVYRSDAQQWFYVFDSDQEGRKMMQRFGYTSYSKSMYSLTNRLYCPTDRVGLQGLFICDSFTAMSPKMIEQKDKNGKLKESSGRAADARAFSENLKKVIGLLQDKAFSLLASQQTRTKPDATYSGVPELYESQGDAIKFLSSNRIRFLNRSVPVIKNAGRDFERAMGENGFADSKVGGEVSYYGPNEDLYSYALMKNIKNRFGIPRLEMMNRVLFKDGSGKAQGHCKVFDTWIYLWKTGRIEKVNQKGKKGAFKINIDATNGQVFDWFEFKGYITARTDPSMMREISKGHFGGNKPADIRSELFKEITKKKVYKLLSRKKKRDTDEEDSIDLEA